MRRFRLRRLEDEGGISGVGIVAEGVEFKDGTCALRWLTKYASTAIYETIGILRHIHGHDGKTIIEMID
jgi:hypothetical protein